MDTDTMRYEDQYIIVGNTGTAHYIVVYCSIIKIF